MKMDKPKRNEKTLNLKIIKYIGLYQIFNPHTIKIGNYNVHQVILLFTSICIISVSILCLFGTYYLTNDLTMILYNCGCIESVIFSCYKIAIIVYYSKNIWKCITTSNFEFMSYEHYNRNIINDWCTRYLWMSHIYTIAVLVFGLFWIISPCMFSNSNITIKNLDGNLDKYQVNVFNFYFIVSNKTYNRYFNLFYLIEIYISIFIGYTYIIMDVTIITIWCALCCQLEVIYGAFRSLGHKPLIYNNLFKYVFIIYYYEWCI